MSMLLEIPTEKEIRALIGTEAFSYWNKMCREIDLLYDMEKAWSDGGKKWTYEYKYRRGGKTLCALYARPNRFGAMIVFGKDEREKVERIRNSLSRHTLDVYDNAATYHDGKWVMFDESASIDDIIKLLMVKRKPNRSSDN